MKKRMPSLGSQGGCLSTAELTPKSGLSVYTTQEGLESRGIQQASRISVPETLQSIHPIHFMFPDLASVYRLGLLFTV